MPTAYEIIKNRERIKDLDTLKSEHSVFEESIKLIKARLDVLEEKVNSE